jgi:hypothetical protein
MDKFRDSTDFSGGGEKNPVFARVYRIDELSCCFSLLTGLIKTIKVSETLMVFP